MPPYLKTDILSKIICRYLNCALDRKSTFNFVTGPLVLNSTMTYSVIQVVYIIFVQTKHISHKGKDYVTPIILHMQNLFYKSAKLRIILFCKMCIFMILKRPSKRLYGSVIKVMLSKKCSNEYMYFLDALNGTIFGKS